MKNKHLLSLLVIATACASTQNIATTIEEAHVTSVLKTLSSDQMKGRSALTADIASATAFIESEFDNIRLHPMSGLKGFRQEFKKERISPERVQVVVNGAALPDEEVIIVSNSAEIESSGGLPVISLAYDSSIARPTQYFYQKAYPFLKDPAPGIMLVATQFRDVFLEFKGYFEDHFKDKQDGDKIYILGDEPVESYAVKVSQRIDTIVMNNVVGVLPGKTRPDEIVLFTAHYDHIGILPPVNGDSIANGADDDASGTTAVIELARYFKHQNENNRTLVFVAFTAEEVGGYGSAYFSQQLDPEQIVAMFNIEMIGKPSKWGQNAAFVTGYERSDLGSILTKNAKETGFSFKPDPYPEQNLFYRSDNATLARLGVPAHTISTDQIDIDTLYHTVNDEFETVDLKNMTATIHAIAVGSRSVVDGTDTPTRIDKATVK